MTRRAVTKSTAPPQSFADNRKRLSQMSKVAERFGKWRPAVEVIRYVEAVPTRFIQYDHTVGVGGHPIARITLVHGNSNEGKSEFALGLGESFLRRDHFFGLVDAERTTPLPWVQSLMKGLERHPGFMALPATTYEQVVGEVRRFCETIAQARASEELTPDTTGLIVVDSIRKLVPENLLKKMLKEVGDDEKPKRGQKAAKKTKGIDGMGGRAAQVKAALNAQWMDELVPLLADTNTAMVIIAREYDNPDPGMYARPWKLGGGKALFLDASVDIRVSRSWVYEGKDEGKVVVGERHSLDVHKTKVSGKVEKVPTAYYHTSNGVLVPEGYDAQRDVLELACDAGLVQRTSNGWYTWGKVRLGNGEGNVVKRLHSDPELFAKVEADARAFVTASVKSVAASSGS